ALNLGSWEDMNVRIFMDYLSLAAEMDDALRCGLIRRHPGLVWLTVEAVRTLSGQYRSTFTLKKDHFGPILSALCQIQSRLIDTGLKEKLSEPDIRWISDLHLLLAMLKEKVHRPAYLLLSKLIIMLCHGITATTASLILLSWRLHRNLHRWIKRDGVLFVTP
ncbi:MAG: hypothetical protein PHQ83_11635, partial [Eubacteriales bacterium]|nr:hypothetical protein [Eubacteriales bacterium]